ncbi:MAG: hypothetical protein ACU843_15200, partial [Gammaproteobacteria bacterium]
MKIRTAILALLLSANAYGDAFVVDIDSSTPCKRVSGTIEQMYATIDDVFQGDVTVIYPITSIGNGVKKFYIKAPNGAPFMVSNSLESCLETVNYLRYG